MFSRQNIEKIGTVQHFGGLGELLQGYSSAQQLLGKGFLTQIADFSEESLSQSSSKGISLSGSSWGRDSLPKLVISVRNPCVRAPTKVFPCLGATVERIPYQIAHVSKDSWSQRSPKGISLSRSSCGEGSLPNC